MRLHELIDPVLARSFLMDEWWPQHRGCPQCNAPVRNQVVDLSRGQRRRCYSCGHTFGWKSGTIWAHAQMSPGQIVALLAGLASGGELSLVADNAGVHADTARIWRRRLGFDVNRSVTTLWLTSKT